MPTKNRLVRLILIASVLCPAFLRAQTSLTLPTIGTAGSGSTAVDFEFRLDGSIVEKGAGTSTLSNSDLQSSSRLIWYPTLEALRAGTGTSFETVSTMGQYSTAFGYQSLASGLGSVALGYSVTASTYGSVALGVSSTASGSCSVALGQSTYAGGVNSVALGYLAIATGSSSVALGSYISATGTYSTALGSSTLASGNYATAMGNDTTANSWGSTAIGYFNKGLSETGATPSLTSRVSTDPLFEVGNGTGPGSSTADALVVYKDGDVQAHGTVRFSPGGDISMGSFTAGTAP